MCILDKQKKMFGSFKEPEERDKQKEMFGSFKERMFVKIVRIPNLLPTLPQLTMTNQYLPLPKCRFDKRELRVKSTLNPALYSTFRLLSRTVILSNVGASREKCDNRSILMKTAYTWLRVTQDFFLRVLLWASLYSV